MMPSSSRIRHDTVRNLAKLRGAPPEALGRRIAALDLEWDLERAVWANGVTVGVVGLALGALDRRFLLLPAAASALLLQQSLKGWSPAVALLRRLGFRTAREIEAERRVLLGMKSEGRSTRLSAAGR